MAMLFNQTSRSPNSANFIVSLKFNHTITITIILCMHVCMYVVAIRCHIIWSQSVIIWKSKSRHTCSNIYSNIHTYIWVYIYVAISSGYNCEPEIIYSNAIYQTVTTAYDVNIPLLLIWKCSIVLRVSWVSLCILCIFLAAVNNNRLFVSVISQTAIEKTNYF